MAEYKSPWDFPYTIYCNVLLVDGKIVNWKTGQTRWSSVDKAMCNRQPLGLLLKANEEGKGLTVAHTSFECTCEGHNEYAFGPFAEEFYRGFKIHDECTLGRPYEGDGT